MLVSSPIGTPFPPQDKGGRRQSQWFSNGRDSVSRGDILQCLDTTLAVTVWGREVPQASGG